MSARLNPGTALPSMSDTENSDSDSDCSEPQANETEEQAEGRRQARLLRKMLVELEGSCLKAWRKFFETGDDGGRINEFQFVRMCRQIRFPADPVLVFRYLDDDASGELTLEELDQEGNDIWATFVEWSAQSFSGANDFIQKMLPKNATEKKVNAAEFEEGLVKFGWTHGNCQMLFQANCLRPNEETIDVSDLKWLDVQAKRAKIKRTARQRAMKDKKTKTNDSKSIQETMVDFKDKLKRSYGNFLRAWRLALSPTDSVTISRTQFLTACSNLGFKDAAKVLWRAFGLDELSPVSLDFLDPETAEVLARFQRLVQGLGGVQAAWRVFDKKDVKRVKMPEFIETMKTLEPNLPAKQLFNGLDTNGDGRLAVEDFKFLEKWKLPEFLTAKPSEEAKEDVKRHLLHVYKSYLKAWRSVLDMDSSNRCTWTEFQAACRKIGFMGDVAGAWRALDSDLSGSITLQEVDKESSNVLATFKAWADDNFGTIRSAFAVFDSDGSNSVTLREWRYACRIYGFNSGASSLFKQLDGEGMGSLSLEQVAFLDDWDFQPEKADTPPLKREVTARPGVRKSMNNSFATQRSFKLKPKVHTPQGLVPPARVCWHTLSCHRPRPPSRGPGTGLPSRAYCCRCRARGACRHFARMDGVRSLAPSPRAAGYDVLMSPDPKEPPMVKMSRFRWLKERLPREMAAGGRRRIATADMLRPKTSPTGFELGQDFHRYGGAEIQVAALEQFPMGTIDFPMVFINQSSRHLIHRAYFKSESSMV